MSKRGATHQHQDVRRWHNAEEAAEVARFQALVQVLKDTLKKPQVWRVGNEPMIEVYVMGVVEGG